MRALSRWFARAGATLTLLGMAAGMGVLAVAFLSAALYLALSEVLDAPLAALATAGALLALAALMVLAVRFLILPARRAVGKLGGPDGPAAAAELGAMLGDETGTWIKRHPGRAMLVALAAGFAVGRNPNLRAKLLRLLR